MKTKKAILVASYGTASETALAASAGALEREFAQAFPDFEVRRAFTGKRLVELLRQRGIPARTAAEELEQLAADGYEEVLVQPTHLLAGEEYDGLCASAEEFQPCFSSLKVGVPLLNHTDDLRAVCGFLAGQYGGETDAVVLMGHGSAHPANRIYADFTEVCRRSGYPFLFAAALEASPTLDDLLPTLKSARYRTLLLAPMLFTAGSHACRNMAGDRPDSWKSRLEREGFTVRTVVKGLGEYGEIRALYAKHLRAFIS
ncbi:MAG: sirohydrochlorin cobaltochelatase [Eubacteriales bacterium]